MNYSHGSVLPGGRVGNQIGRVGLVGAVAGTFSRNFVNRFAVRILGINKKAVLEILFQFREKRVVVRVGVGGELKHRADERAWILIEVLKVLDAQ